MSAALLRLPLRLVRRGAVLLVLTASGYALVEVVSYENTYTDGASRAQLARLGDNAAVRVLQGAPRAVDTVGGFVVWDAGWFLALVASVWAVLAATRLARGEEDDGRADVVLSRPVRRRDLLLAQLAAVGAGAVAFGAAVAATLIAAGLPAGGSLLFGAGLAGVGVTSGSAGALAAQLLDVRRRAAAAAVAFVGVAFALRMLGHSADDRDALLWATPLGWLDQLHAFSG
ncbi:MAG: ABC transporter permease subunit, partial [Actinomycetes bacterium]